MNDKLARFLNKKYGILFMVSSVFLVIILLLNLHWRADFTFMQNLSYGYIFRIDDFFDEECNGSGLYRRCTEEHLYFYFKYLAIIPMVTFVFGLFGYLNDAERNA
ncbi:MAG: hypothetical protein ABJK37_16040 [Paraglaciecola sp.]|uniref:hypothetical protein n=1 Tax=Paraglaciecola sp. TaxID=1920173 RepID=UPI00329A3DF5